MAFDPPEDRDPTVFSFPPVWAAVAVSLFVALIYRHPELSLLSAMVLLLLAGAKLWSRLSLSKVTCSIHLVNERAFPQETVSLQTTVKNAKFLPVWVSIRWPGSRVLGGPDDAFGAPQETGLLWYQEAQFHMSLKAHRRGVFQVGPSHLYTSDAFGFYQSAKRMKEVAQVLVYPRLVELKPVHLPKHDLFGTPGDQNPVKDPVYVMGTRDYQPSRPSRHIHWTASARQRRLQEKLFEPSAQGSVMMVLDVDEFEKDPAQEAFENTLEVIASLSLRLNKMAMAVGLMTNGATHGGDFSAVPAGRSPRHLSAILELLARLHMRKRDSLPSVIRHGPRIERGAHAAFFCYQNGQASEWMIRRCRNRSTQLTVLAWRISPASVPDTASKATGIRLIGDMRSQSREDA